MTNYVVLCEQAWSYVVFRQADTVYLTFLIGGVVEQDCTVQLTSAEVLAIQQAPNFTVSLIEQLKADHDAMATRRLASTIWPTTI